MRKISILFLTFSFFVFNAIKPSEKSKEAEALFIKLNLPFDRAFVKKNSFNEKTVLMLALVIEECILERMRIHISNYVAAGYSLDDTNKFISSAPYVSNEHAAREYLKLFHFYLVQLCDLYDIEVDDENLQKMMRIDDLVEAHFLESINHAKRDDKNLEGKLRTLLLELDLKH